MKTTYYFSHDFNARTDNKIKHLIKDKGWTGYGLFWAIVEDLYNNANALPLDYDSIAYDLRTDNVTIKSIICDYELFENDGDFFWSNSVQRRLDEREERSVKARQSANKRWNNANAMQSHSEGNAIKERKGNKIKGNKIKGNENNVDVCKVIYPTYEDFKELPGQYIESVKMQTHQTKKILLESSTIIELWDAFKLQNLDGQKLYQNENDVYRHFVNWFKTQKFENNGTTTKSRSQKHSDGLHYLLNLGKTELAKVMAINQQNQTD